ncbi:hypothetical protein LTR15_009530 [Elasticomyces elasticus]|nr:hypothetical protein LTR15_009530 [Elasticomyces elasticus]
MAAGQYQQITQADVDHFLEHGWLKLSNCFTQEQSDDLIKTVWTRLGMSPDDKSTWNTERVNMPKHSDFEASDLAPKAWSAICDLLSGEDRISEENRTWGDGLIVNLGTPEGEGKEIRPQDLPGWHVDGDFFVHYLDSPEQGLLVIPLFTDIAAGGGGTMICPGAIPTIAKYLRDHPEGVSPRFTPRGQNPTFKEEDGLKWFCELAHSLPDEAFVEATGKVGDIYLLHPLMLHSASNNKLRTLRIITNPPVSVNEPFNFNRADKSQYSLVERKTLGALGVESLGDWKITAPRERVIPARMRRMAEMKAAELKRLEELQKTQPIIQAAEVKVQ